MLAVSRWFLSNGWWLSKCELMVVILVDNNGWVADFRWMVVILIDNNGWIVDFRWMLWWSLVFRVMIIMVVGRGHIGYEVDEMVVDCGGLWSMCS